MRSIFSQLFSEQAVDGHSESENVENATHLVVAVDSEESAALTVRVKGSIQNTPPDFSAAQSPTNQWAYLQLKNLEDGTSIAGSDGLALVGTDANKLYEVNTNAVKYVAAEVSGRTAGKVSVALRAFTED